MFMTDDTEANARKFVKKFKLTFPVALDPGEISDAYKLIGHPVSYFINADGRIVDQVIGSIDEKMLTTKFNELFFNK